MAAEFFTPNRPPGRSQGGARAGTARGQGASSAISSRWKTSPRLRRAGEDKKFKIDRQRRLSRCSGNTTPRRPPCIDSWCAIRLSGLISLPPCRSTHLPACAIGSARQRWLYLPRTMSKPFSRSNAVALIWTTDLSVGGVRTAAINQHINALTSASTAALCRAASSTVTPSCQNSCPKLPPARIARREGERNLEKTAIDTSGFGSQSPTERSRSTLVGEAKTTMFASVDGRRITFAPLQSATGAARETHAW